jgi:hypothetical protein
MDNLAEILRQPKKSGKRYPEPTDQDLCKYRWLQIPLFSETTARRLKVAGSRTQRESQRPEVERVRSLPFYPLPLWISDRSLKAKRTAPPIPSDD